MTGVRLGFHGVHQNSYRRDVLSTAFTDTILVSEFVSELIEKDLNNVILTNADIGKIKRNLKGIQIEVTHRNNLGRNNSISGLTALTIIDSNLVYAREAHYRAENKDCYCQPNCYARIVASHEINWIMFDCS